MSSSKISAMLGVLGVSCSVSTVIAVEVNFLGTSKKEPSLVSVNSISIPLVDAIEKKNDYNLVASLIESGADIHEEYLLYYVPYEEATATSLDS